MTKTKKDKLINYPDKRKAASDSKTSAQEVVVAEAVRIPTHMQLSDHAIIYFWDIIDERANADWSKHDISMAAKLARMMSREDELDARLDDEGPTVAGAQGGVTKNPTATVLTNVRGSIATFRRQLCLHAQAGNTSSKELGARRGQRKSTQDAANTGDPLLA